MNSQQPQGGSSYSHQTPIELFYSIVDLVLEPSLPVSASNDFNFDSPNSEDLPSSLSTDASSAIKLSSICQSVRKSSQKALFESPVLDRDSAEKFKNVLERESIAHESGQDPTSTPRLSSLVSSLTFKTKEVSKPFQQHEHVPTSTILQILRLTDVESLSLDMSCGMVGCDGDSSGRLDWSSDDAEDGMMKGKLKLKNLEHLALRCPKGYLPPGTRSLLRDQLDLPSLKSLDLLFTQPGTFQPSRTSYNLTSILELVPSVQKLNLTLVEPKDEIFDSGLLSPKSIIELNLSKIEQSRIMEQLSPTNDEEETSSDQKELMKEMIKKGISKVKPDSQVTFTSSFPTRTSKSTLSNLDFHGSTDFLVSYQTLKAGVEEKFDAHQDSKWAQLVRENQC